MPLLKWIKGILFMRWDQLPQKGTNIICNKLFCWGKEAKPWRNGWSCYLVTRRSQVWVMDSGSCKCKVKLPTIDPWWVWFFLGSHHGMSLIAPGCPFLFCWWKWFKFFVHYSVAIMNLLQWLESGKHIWLCLPLLSLGHSISVDCICKAKFLLNCIGYDGWLSFK